MTSSQLSFLYGDMFGEFDFAATRDAMRAFVRENGFPVDDVSTYSTSCSAVIHADTIDDLFAARLPGGSANPLFPQTIRFALKNGFAKRRAEFRGLPGLYKLSTMPTVWTVRTIAGDLYRVTPAIGAWSKRVSLPKGLPLAMFDEDSRADPRLSMGLGIPAEIASTFVFPVHIYGDLRSLSDHDEFRRLRGERTLL